MNAATVGTLVEAITRSARERCTHLLTLADRSPYSASHGCFDRSWWQYRIKDFPSGMGQEGLYPLALALEEGLFPRLSPAGRRDLEGLIAAAAAFSLRRQHRNGSVDDYFPWEQAAGATAFSLYAILATLGTGRLGLDPCLEPALRRRVGWLAGHRESGRLSNHEALIVLCLALAARRWDDPRLHAAAAARFEGLLGWRSREGWFEEYGGFDVGYESLTFACLHDLSGLWPRRAADLAPVLSRTFSLIVESAEPDGCLGGELYARGTWNLFAHGLLAYALPRGGDALDSVLRLLAARFLHHPTEVRDDYVLQHHLWSDLRTLALLRRLPPGRSLPEAAAPEASVPEPSPFGTGAGPGAPAAGVSVVRSLPEAGHLWVRHGACLTHVSLAAGGAFRHYLQGRFVVQDTQHALTTGRGRRRRGWLANDPGARVRWHWQTPDTLVIEGPLSPYRPQPMTTFRLVLLRILMAAGGRFCADRIRALMQRMLIHGAADPRRSYRRLLQFLPQGLRVEDRYHLPRRELPAARLTATAFATFRHVVMSRVFHPYVLLLQDPLTCREGRQGDALVRERFW